MVPLVVSECLEGLVSNKGRVSRTLINGGTVNQSSVIIESEPDIVGVREGRSPEWGISEKRCTIQCP